MANVTVTNTFTNSTTADATQVNQNFTDIINGTSDGTKDFSISALTVAGTATLNGNVNLGNSTSDDLTIGGSLAATIAIKTTNSFDIGSTTLGLRALFFGQSSGAFTAKLQASTLAASVTHSLPSVTGTLGLLPAFTAAKTTTYAVTTADNVIPVSASGGSWTATLYAASGNAGREVTFVRTDQTLANQVTVDGNSSETINGATTIKLATQYEVVTLICDGTGWHIKDRTIPSLWTSFTPTGAFTTNVTYTGFWRRSGDSVEVVSRLVFSGSTDGSTGFTLNLPTGLAMDTAKITTQTINEGNFGLGSAFDSGVGHVGTVAYQSTTSVTVLADNGGGAWSDTLPFTIGNGDKFHVNFVVPIANWES